LGRTEEAKAEVSPAPEAATVATRRTDEGNMVGSVTLLDRRRWRECDGEEEEEEAQRRDTPDEVDTGSGSEDVVLDQNRLWPSWSEKAVVVPEGGVEPCQCRL
jgi:hypothetical protein